MFDKVARKNDSADWLAFTDEQCLAAQEDFPLGFVKLNVDNTGDLMLRKEDLILESGESDAALLIRDRCFLGRGCRYCLVMLSGKELHARTSAQTALSVGAKVKINVACDALKLFF